MGDKKGDWGLLQYQINVAELCTYCGVVGFGLHHIHISI